MEKLIRLLCILLIINGKNFIVEKNINIVLILLKNY